MQQIYAWLDTGDGLTPLNDHSQDIAMLDSVSIQWGCDDPSEQPDPSVATIRLIDRTGQLAGDFVRLSMARLVLTMSAQPTWDDCIQYGTWGDCEWPISRLDQRWRPDTIASGDTVALFDGIIATGGTVTRHADAWLIQVTASSRMILWTREQRQGPTSGDRHWTDTPAARLAELNKRAKAIGAPLADTMDISLPPSCASYDLNTYPSLLDLLHRLTAHDPRAPLWHDHADGRATSISRTDLAATTDISLDDTGQAWTIGQDGTTRPAIPSDRIRTDDDMTLTIVEPVTGVTVQGKRASKDSDGTVTFDQSDMTYTAGGLPDNLTVTQHVLTRESDAVLVDEAGGYAVWTPTTADKERMAAWIETRDRRMVPETLTIDSRDLDPAEYPWLFRPEPSGPVFASGPSFATLADRDGNPAASGVWTTIGGTWSFAWESGRPVIRNDVQVLPMPVATDALPTWDDLADWPVTWDAVTLTWAQIRLATAYHTTTITAKETR